MSTNEAVIEALSWRVVVRRVGDRGQHTIYVNDGEAYHPFLTSVEGTSDELWPSSPPLQQWHVETRPHSQVLLGVGMAGHSHWSLSIEASAEHNWLTFDVACRARRELGSLGSRYQFVSPDRLSDRAELKYDFPVPFTPLLLCSSAAGIHFQVDPAAYTGPGTIRWQYRLKLVD